MSIDRRPSGRHFSWLLIAPQFVLMGLIIIAPAVFMVRLAFAKTDFIGFQWVGFANFVELFSTPDMGKVIANTGLYILFNVPVTTAIALVVALLSYDFGKSMRSYLRVVLYLPMLTSGLVISTVWRWVWHPSVGLANWLLSLVGLEPVWWLGGRMTGIFAISCNLVLSSLGYMSMVMMASILSVGKELLDAAVVDGATPWQVRLRIIVPTIAPTIALMGTLSMIGVTQMWETVMATTNGGPDHGTSTLMFDIYETGFLRGRFGFGSAKTVLLVALVLGLTIIRKRIEKWQES